SAAMALTQTPRGRSVEAQPAKARRAPWTAEQFPSGHEPNLLLYCSNVLPNRYRLTRAIATGGMAQVYQAVAVGHHGFERRVAIKRVLPEFAGNESMRRMFLDEARIASSLHHGNIRQVLDYGFVDQTEFLVMEYVDGIDLQRARSKGRTLGHPMEEGIA